MKRSILKDLELRTDILPFGLNFGEINFTIRRQCNNNNNTSNFNGSNTFGVMEFETGIVRASDHSARSGGRSGGKIGISFRFSFTWRHIMCSH